ncbi:subtilisin-like protease SBT1.9 [Senna tora]|uniref:Subtilisin-like protease SBT1.9 n=1 Tax=Senna tora TaxID=362788 RepID=A0A834U186_9FABA|nr:subtilisin-like protease SBT1.9 [Senna tora]
MAQSDNYIIHMDLSAMPKAFSTQHTWYLSTLATALDNVNPQVLTDFNSVSSSKLIYSYTHVMNGFSANLSPSELQALKASPGYISSFPDLPVKHDTTHSPQFLGLNPKLGAWPASNYGSDIIIGLVDSGIWPESQSFQDKGIPNYIPSRWKGKCESGTQFNSSLCNNKLIGARFFNRGLSAKYPNVTIVVNSTRDTDGHGTHTSSTAAGTQVEAASYFGYASGSATGVAPRARVAMYKALWEFGAQVSDIIAAVDSAIADGVDVLSLSLGYNYVPLYEDPIAIATFAALEKGIFVSTSAGNNGPFLETLHNGTPWVITVAAGTLDREFHGTLKLTNNGDDNRITGLSLYPGNFSSTKDFPLVFLDTCDDLKEMIKVRSNIVVCEDKNGTQLGDQVDNLERAQVIGGVFISNSSDVTFYFQTKFASIFINPTKGETVKDYIKKNGSKAKASMVFNMTDLGTKPAPSVDSYSSRGPSQSCPFVLKPDVTAPGTLILAAWPHNVPVTQLEPRKNLFSDFNLLSGTSMSCPHVAGLGALIKGAHPNWSPAAIRSAIMTTSDIMDNELGLIKDIGDDYKSASPLALGAGHINPNRAIDPGLVYDVEIEDYVNLLCALNFTQKNITVITRSSSYICSKPSLDLNYPSFIAFFSSGSNHSSSESKTVVREFERTVSNVGGGETTYIAGITPVKGFQVSVVPDKLVFKEKNEKLRYKLRIEGPKMMKEDVAYGERVSNP